MTRNNMAYYLIRGTYSAEGYRGMIDNPSDREIATRALNQQLGIETIAYFNSLSEAGFVGILKANPDQMATAQMVGMSSGAFTKVSAEELTPSTVFLEGQKAGAQIKFDAPNRDEIDRLLHDE